MEEKERLLTFNELFETAKKIKGVYNNDIYDFLDVLEYFAKKGKSVSAVFSGYLLHSKDVDKYKSMIENDENIFSILEKYNEKERLLTFNELFETAKKINGKYNNDLQDFINVLEYYAKKGENVSVVFSGYLLHSKDVDKYRNALSSGESIFNEKYISLEELEKEDDNLHHM